MRKLTPEREARNRRWHFGEEPGIDGGIWQMTPLETTKLLEAIPSLGTGVEPGGSILHDSGLVQQFENSARREELAVDSEVANCRGNQQC